MSSILGGKQQQRGGVLNRLPAVSPGITTGAGSGLRTNLDFDLVGGQGGGGQVLLRDINTTASLAPQIGEIRNQTLGGIGNLIGDVQSDIQTMRSLENPFIQARTSPFIAQQEQARRDAMRRGVSGPLLSLATNPFTAQIADQRAIAMKESQDAISRGQQQIQSLLQDQSGQGQQLLQQELALLGFQQDQIRDIIASQLTQQEQGIIEQTRPNLVQGAGQIAGGLGGLMAGFCWVAREVYGVDDPRWLQFREWLFNSAPLWLFKLYGRYGERFAGWIKDKPRIKGIIKGLMNKAIKNG